MSSWSNPGRFVLLPNWSKLEALLVAIAQSTFSWYWLLWPASDFLHSRPACLCVRVGAFWAKMIANRATWRSFIAHGSSL